MRLGDALGAVAALVVPEKIDQLRERVDPAWVGEALLATGTASVRRRRLPAEMVVWMVIGMALLRNLSIERVVALLGLAMPSKRGDTTARSAIAQARRRLGSEPMEYLFATTADHWAHQLAAQRPWRGLALYGVDGTTLRVPDAPENWAAYGGQIGNGLRPGSAYPTVRLVALMALRSHQLAAVQWGGYEHGETNLALDLWPHLPDHSLTIFDRNFLVWRDLVAIQLSGNNRHWISRAKVTTRYAELRRLGPNDHLVEISTSTETRAKYPWLPVSWPMRAIRYQRRGSRPGIILTSLCDPKQYPATEVVALYHERWELEIGYDELKTDLLERQEAIRSRTPAGVAQEIWGIALAYNLVRLEMVRAAHDAGVPPNRISFVNALALIRNAWLTWSQPPMAPGRIPEYALDLRRHLKLLLLPERRPTRSYPRAVKLKISGYAKKPPTGKGRK
jgi:hypothetical protein